MMRLFARAPRGERAVGSVPKNWGGSVTILGAMRVGGVLPAMTVAGSTDRDVFGVFTSEALDPTLGPGDIVVVENLGVHYAAGIREVILATGAEVNQPPDPPDLNPIERCWSKLKTYLRAAKARLREALDEVITRAFATIIAHDAAAWFVHPGYVTN
jgi:transposase